MKRVAHAILIILTAGWMAYGCIDAPMFDSVPEISNARLELGNPPITPGDSGTFVNLLFDFSDGDGDIGRLPGDTMTENLFLENSQLDTTFIETSFSIPFIPPNGGVPDITGTVRVQLNISTFQGFCLARPDLTQVEYKLWIRDREGNTSNMLDVPPIPLECN
jgi:hypothetical protein